MSQPDVGAVPLQRSAARGTSPVTAEVLLDAALRLFRAKGYHGTSVRDIAKSAGLTVAAVYHHYDSKQALLVRIMTSAMAENLRLVQRAAAGSQHPPTQLAAMVADVVSYHLTHQAEAFVGNSELRSLEKDGLRTVVDLRDQEEHLFTDVVGRGIDEGVFAVAEANQAARAIIAMCSAVANWYRPGGRYSKAQICRQYVDMSLNLVGLAGR